MLTTAENTYKALRVPAEECGRRSFALVRTVVEKEGSPFLSGLWLQTKEYVLRALMGSGSQETILWATITEEIKN